MTKKKDPEVLPKEPPRPTGRPSKYKPEFCRAILDHFKQGNSFESFAGNCGVSIQTAYSWLKEHPEFLDAKNEAEGLLHKFYEDLGKMLATGQIRRVKSEEPVIGADGKAVLDPRTGEVLMKREYEPVSGNSTAWIFLTKNMLGWSDKKMVAFGHMPQEGRRAEQLTPAERMQEINEMTKALQDLAEADTDGSPGESA